MYHVRMTRDMGRGVFASRDIKAGEVIARCEILVLSTADSATINETDMRWYLFRFNNVQDCIVLGDGEIFNHADKENVSYQLVTQTDAVSNRQVMEFRAIQPILEDEQLFINYTRDAEVRAEDYTVSLVG